MAQISIEDLTRKQSLMVSDNVAQEEYYIASALIRLADASETNLPRITKAVEWLAGDYQKAKKDLEWYRTAYREQSGKINSLQHAINGHKGHIARLKTRIKELTPVREVPESGSLDDIMP